MIDKMYGRIKWFQKAKGYGYIIGYDDETYYFEIENLLVDINNVKPGLLIKFIPNNYTDIPFADKIEEEQNSTVN